MTVEKHKVIASLFTQSSNTGARPDDDETKVRIQERGHPSKLIDQK